MMIEEIEMIEIGIEEERDKNIDKKKEIIIIIRMILKFNKIKLYLYKSLCLQLKFLCLLFQVKEEKENVLDHL